MQEMTNQEAAARCYAAIGEADDVEIAQRLWRAFSYYFRQARREAMELQLQGLSDGAAGSWCDVSDPPLAQGGEEAQREAW
jgi:hypothetical protein